MFSQSAQVYDLVYRKFKNFEAESRAVTDLVRREYCGARTVLDVGCGTGEHAWYLSREFLVDGIDLDCGMLRVAHNKGLKGHFIQADMCEFNLGRRYDVVLCLFSSIGYVRTYDRLVEALRCFHHHLNQGGVVVVEGWFDKSEWAGGRCSAITAEGDGLTVCRMSHSSREGSLSKIHFEYLIGSVIGVEYVTEDHLLGLFSAEEMLQAFRAAGLVGRLVEQGLSDRRLYVARRE